MGRREYSDETRAAVMAALMEGQSINSVAREYGIPKGTIGGWRKQTEKIITESLSVANDATQKKQERISELLVDLLIAKIESQTALAQHAGTKPWLLDQDASAVAMLMGVGDDKLMRMLESFQSAKSEPRPSQN